MNILFLLGVYPSYGGVEKVTTVLANEFTKNNHCVHIVSFEQPHLELLEELREGITLHKLDYPVGRKENRKILRQIIEDFDIDLLINQWCVPFYVTRLCRKGIHGRRCALIAVHHNAPTTNARIKDAEAAIERGKHVWLNKIRLQAVRFVSRLSLRYTLDRSDAYVVLSPSFISAARHYMFNPSAGKIKCIPNPITIPIADEDVNVVEKQKEILYVGRIEYGQKRTFRLVEIWNELHHKFPDWRLTIVGDGPDRNDLERRIAESKLGNISIEGYQNPIPYYQRASILVLVSEFEGFPLILTESMSQGVVPVGLGSYSAIYDVIDDSCGVIVSYPYESTAFSDKLEYLMNNDGVRRRMAQEAIRKSSKFRLEGINGEWENLFKELQP